jgi:hypothetical protein
LTANVSGLAIRYLRRSINDPNARCAETEQDSRVLALSDEHQTLPERGRTVAISRLQQGYATEQLPSNEAVVKGFKELRPRTVRSS